MCGGGRGVSRPEGNGLERMEEKEMPEDRRLFLHEF